MRALGKLLAILFLLTVISPPFWPVMQAQQQTGSILIGRVVNESDVSQAGATVTVLSENSVVQSTTTGTDGQFSINFPKAGQYEIVVNLDGFRPQNETITIREEPLNYTIKLLPSSLHVVVLGVNQEKLSDAVVTIKGEDGVVKRAIESPKGEYYFGRLKAGIYQLTASITGYEVSVDEGVYIATDNKTVLRTQLLQRASPIPIGEKLKERFLSPLIASNRVQAILQDHQGIIWVGTSRGVTRLYGISPSEYKELPSAGMRAQDTLAIFQDSKKNFWLATRSATALKRNDSKNFELFQQLAGKEVRSIVEDHNGQVWFGTDKGLYSYNSTRLQQTPLPSNDVRHLICEKQGEAIWAATAAGVVRISKGRFQPLAEDGKPVDWPTNFILEDSRRSLWFLTDTGVKQYDGQQIISIPKTELTRAMKYAVEDKIGNLWFAGAERAAYVYDLKRDEVSELFDTDKVLTILSDREGSLWFGTENGLVNQDFYSFVNFNTGRGLPATEVYSLLADSSKPEALWVGTSSGLIYFNGTSFSRVLQIPSELTVNAILKQKNGLLWVATSDGLYCQNGNVWNRYGLEVGLPSNNIRHVCEDVRNGGLWVATQKGVSRFNPNFGIDNSSSSEQLQIKAEVRHIYQQKNGTFWFATDKGVYRYDSNTYDLTVIAQSEGLESIDTRWIASDEVNGLVMVATGKGIEFISGQRALPLRRPPTLTGESIQCIFRDRDGMFWFGSPDGKIKKYFNTNINTVGYAGAIVSTYTKDKHGFAGNDIRDITQDNSGAIWFATETGLTRHFPSQSIPNIECKLEVNGAEVTSTNIEAGQHNIKFRFVGISTLGDVGFVYRAVVNGQPLDYHWVSPQSVQREAIFNGLSEDNPFLPDGEHIFEVKAINRDLYGLYSQPLEIRIRIDKPFWRKLWFHLFVGLLVTGATVSIAVFRHRQRRQYTLPAHLKSFVAIEPNPYIVGNPIRNPSMFFGREDDFNYARIKLEGAAQGGVVLVLCGERRVGKSSILYQIVNGRLGELFIPVFIDLQEMVVSNDHEFFGRIAKLVAEAVSNSEEKSHDSTIRRAKFPFSDPSKNAFHLFADFLDSTLTEIGEKRLLILMDEYELLENKVEEAKLSKEIFTFMASLIDNRDRLSFVFTGSRRLEERDRRYWREMLRRSLFRKVSFLSERDARRLITDPVKDKMVYGRGVVDAIYRLTSGQPFYTQYICQSIVDHLNEWKRNYVLKSDLKVITEEIIDNPLPQMIYFWEGFNDDEKLVMSLLAEVLLDSDSVANSRQLIEAIKRENYPVNLSEHTIRLTLEELFRADVLKKVEDENFFFRIDLFRPWIKQSHSIWRVVKELRAA